MTYKMYYQGSVKNLYESETDILFEYSDRYSLFDWGEMPDKLSKKGEALATMGALFFTELTQFEIPHHFLGISNPSGEILDWRPSRYLKVKKIPVFRPDIIDGKYDYSFYKTFPQEGLVPLEVIFRFGAGKGSSLVKRVEKDSFLLQQWNLDGLKQDTLWDHPLIDFSTKLEKGDRYLTHQEAKIVAGLSDVEFDLLITQTIKIGLILRNIFTQMGLELWDGKLELAFLAGASRTFMLVDSIGLDELRLQRNGVSLSKEFLREFYRKTPWFEKLNSAKEIAGRTGEDFKKICTEAPPALSLEEKELTESLYLSFTNELALKIIGKTIFDKSYSLSNWGDKR